MQWKAIRFFRASEREHAERVARRLGADGRPVRVERCGRNGLRLVAGEDERREERPVPRDRRGS